MSGARAGRSRGHVARAGAAGAGDESPGSSGVDATYAAALDEQQLSAAVEDVSLVGEVVADRYRVIGRGGMGNVYECENVQLQKRVALDNESAVAHLDVSLVRSLRSSA